jgi:hypothetical protein
MNFFFSSWLPQVMAAVVVVVVEEEEEEGEKRMTICGSSFCNLR